MGVVIKRKDGSSFVPPPAIVATPMSDLEAVFGDVEPETLRPGAVHGLCKDDPVVITNTHYPWVKHWQAGDTGTVVEIMSAAYSAQGHPHFDPAKHTQYKIKLDHVRDPKFPVVEFPRWAIELLHGVHEV